MKRTKKEQILWLLSKQAEKKKIAQEVSEDAIQEEKSLGHGDRVFDALVENLKL